MIRHILSDGTEVPDVDGFVVSREDHAVLYEVISNITQKEGENCDGSLECIRHHEDDG